MHTFLSFSQALVLSLLCTAIFGRQQESRAKRLEEIIEREQDVEKRGICYNDDTLESFKEFIVDAAPYCSSLLSIVDFTSTVSATTRTTTSTLSTTYVTTTVTATRASVTIFSTSYVPNLLRRDDPAPTPAPFYDENPYAYSVLANDVNASIAASYYSACSCLSLKPSTVESIALTSTTRTISGLDSEETTVTEYVTSGTSTQVLTRAGGQGPVTVSTTVSVIPTPLPITNTSVPVPLGTGSSSVGTLVSSVSRSSAGVNSSLSLSTIIGSSSTRPTIAPTLNVTSTPVPSLTPIISSNLTTRLPPVTGPSSGFPPFPTSGNLSSTIRPSSGFPPLPTVNGTTSRPTSGFPTLSINSSIISRPSSGLPTPSTNLTITSRLTSGSPVPSSNQSISSLPISSSPTPFSNVTVTVSTTIRPTSTSASLGFPAYPLNSTIFTPAVTASVTVTAISTPGNTYSSTSTVASAAATTSSPSAVPTLDISNCPGLNGTIVTLSDGQTYAVVCETEYSGPSDVGLQEDTFQQCIQDCGIANNGFSAVRCRGVTYFPFRDTGNNCNFKNAAGLTIAYENEYAVSAVLINYTALNTTIAPPSSFPTATL